MPMQIFHPLQTDIKRPSRLNNPFYYEPHPLCLLAANAVQQYIAAQKAWKEEVDQGKMFGVLVCEDTTHRLGFLAAYSGQIGGRSDLPYFVPAVFDYLQPDGYFMKGVTTLDEINAAISQKESSSHLQELRLSVETLRRTFSIEEDAFKDKIKAAKAERDRIRKGNLSFNEDALIKESQFMKAEFRRIKKSHEEEIAHKAHRLQEAEDTINKEKRLRKEISDHLQHWLFEHFVMLNAKGEKRNLLDIFKDTVQKIPPAGAGECCEPKLLQYAFLHHYHPLCMAMFWWGASPKMEIRHHLHYYPACNGKCKPILKFMLQGMDVAPNPLEAIQQQRLQIIFEDDDLLVVNKPAGMLSVPGKSQRQSVYSLIREQFPEAEGPLIVHRLDMATSGLMLVAKTKEAHRRLQAQFKEHTIHKRYIAILSHAWNHSSDTGSISLPLRPNPSDRPRQMVDDKQGKSAITQYHVLSKDKGEVRIALYPMTGRTHQLRVHCAHKEGLDNPIKGDELYGKKSDRLYLHAEAITFTHPKTGQRMHFERKADF